MAMTLTPEIFIDSRAARDQHVIRVGILDRVKALRDLHDDLYMTTDLVAQYFEVGIEAIKSLVKDNREELEANGHRVISGDELRSFKALSGIQSRSPSLALFPRRSIMNIAMLLRDSEVARGVRSYLLRAEESTVPDLSTPEGQVAVAEMLLETSKRSLALTKENRALSEQNMNLVAQNIELVPRATQADEWRRSDGQMLVGDFANRLNQWALHSMGIQIRHQDVWNYLGHLGMIIRGETGRNNQATSKAINNGWIRMRDSYHERSNGETVISSTPRLTPEGFGYAWDHAVRDLTKYRDLKAHR